MKTYIYKVIEIINEYQIIIDYGSDKGAIVGDQVLIYNDNIKVKHPLNGHILGYRTVEKSTLQIVKVDKLFSICEKAKDTVSRILDSPTPNESNRRGQKLNVDQASMVGEFDNVIRIGDNAKLIIKG